MPTTEIAVLTLKADADINDPNNYAAAVANESFDTLWAVDGVQQVQFGTALENPKSFQLMVTWDSIANHEACRASAAFAPFVESQRRIMDGGLVSMMHVAFQPAAALAKILAAPITEIATAYFAGEAPTDYIETVVELDKALRDTEGYLGYAVGISHETVEKEGVRGKAAVLVVGWQSVEAHMALRHQPSFMETVKTLRSSSKVNGMVHVRFRVPGA
ncbi:hypothetical protein LTR53_013152 [Teratosphaeriaceae sp. CCFEE 6253]|nr:hypothetical protein LTR53_013152 [Teratosphaeriaceae sp. CCFEE 6253]